jgi:hypothetical protein
MLSACLLDSLVEMLAFTFYERPPKIKQKWLRKTPGGLYLAVHVQSCVMYCVHTWTHTITPHPYVNKDNWLPPKEWCPRLASGLQIQMHMNILSLPLPVLRLRLSHYWYGVDLRESTLLLTRLASRIIAVRVITVRCTHCWRLQHQEDLGLPFKSCHDCHKNLLELM